MTPAQHKIYALVDPRTDAVRYIGKTENALGRRLRGHIQRSSRTCSCKPWVDELLSLGLRPAIILLELVPDGVFWAAREVFWIAKYRASGPGLLNKADGGAGQSGTHVTKEARDRLRMLGKAKYSDPEQRRLTGEKSKAYWETPGAKEAQAERMRAQMKDPEKLKRLRDAQARSASTPEFRAKRSDIIKKLWNDGKFQASLENPSNRAARSEQAKKQWADPAIREKMGPAISIGKAAGKRARQ